jgi:1,2-diacylglycerol 3-alpha-glucosyltransferase
MKKNLSMSEPMIGIFNDSFPPVMDGVAVAAKNYAYWLDKKVGHTCVITPKCPDFRYDEHFPVYHYTSFPIPFRKPYRYGFPYVDWQFLRKMERIPFELVHAHCPFSSGTVAMRIAKRQGIPIIATFHSKYRQDFERVIPNKFIIDCIIKNIIKFYEMADEVWIPQADVEDTIREYGFKGRVEVVDNGNDFSPDGPLTVVKAMAREQLGLKKDENVLLFVGQHIWEKNTAFIINALELIKDLPYRMFFVGTGYAAAEMKQMVAIKGLSGKVSFVGQLTDRATLSNYYAAADLFLFPSKYDNAPLVVREAAALGTPSILMANSTSAGIVRDDFNGFTSQDSISAFSHMIRILLLDKQFLRRVGMNASHSIARPWSDVIEEVRGRYEEIISRQCADFVYCV